MLHLLEASLATGRIASPFLDDSVLAALSDALEYEGCDDPLLLGHLRGEFTCYSGVAKKPVRHVRGCWALRALRGEPTHG